MRPCLPLLQIAVAAGTAAALLFGLPARADEVADFYKGKSATLYLGYPPGGAYDIYARLIARHMSRHMPGNPQFIVRHKPGAASPISSASSTTCCRATAASLACSHAAWRSAGFWDATAPTM